MKWLTVKQRDRVVYTVLITLLWSAFAFTMASFVGVFEGPTVGDQVPDFSLKSTSGQFFSTAEGKETKGYILVFMSNHCPCSGKYESRIIQLDKKYKALGYPVVAINAMDPVKYPTESLDLMKARCAMKKYTFPYLADPTKEVAKQYGIVATPSVCVVQKHQGKLYLRYSGAIDDYMQRAELVKNSYADNAVEQLLKGEAVSTPQTRAFGCSIYN
jgi:peroxiredoxin